MEIGYRIMRASDIGTQQAKFAQISLWRQANWGVSDGERGIREAIAIAAECKARGIRTVFHPLEYPLVGELGSHTLEVMIKLAKAGDLGIIIHDEGGPRSTRLRGAESKQYGVYVQAVSRHCPVSIENSYNSSDIIWFWEQFVLPMPPSVTITLDIGHLEGAGIDSVAFVIAMPQYLIERVRFVHIHHYDKDAKGVQDHRSLVPGCREIQALKLLLQRKNDLSIIVELDSADEAMKDSIQLLQSTI